MKLNFFTKLMFSLGAVALMSSCSLDDDSNYNVQPVNDVALGLIANASPNSGSLYFFADDNQVNNLALNYTDAEGYYRFRLGERVLSIRDQAGTVLDTAHVNLTAGKNFTAFAVNRFSDIELVTYSDSIIGYDGNRALVRFINLSPDANGITVATSAQTFATDLEFKESSGFIAVQSGTYELKYTDTESGTALHTDATVEFYPGMIYTIYTKGFVNPTAGSNDTFSTERLRHN